MTETPQQPSSALTEDEQKSVRSAVLRACALVAQAEPGFFDTFKESFAASKAVKAASPEMQRLVTGGLPEMPSGGKDEVNARTLELLKQAVAILTDKAPHLVEEYRQVVLQSARDVAAAAGDTSQNETAAVSEIERALAG
jgi:tellurite resistance protein